MIMNNTYFTNMPTWIRTFVEDTLIEEVFNKIVINKKLLIKGVFHKNYLIKCI
ncbi:MAG: hypothetical protein K0S41_4169 [Anaerocolumna sp.]|jgi:hypothetical protein|nr:hypothetical protein [Anaerocolumna sp.]